MVSIDITEFAKHTSALRPSMTKRVFQSYTDMRGATEAFIDEQPSEGRLLMILMLSNMFFVLSWSVKALITPTAAASATMGADIALWLVVAMMMRTTMIYATALFTGLVCRMLGGVATVQETRAGVFWGVFVAAPIGLAVAGLATVIASLSDVVPFFQNENVQLMPYWLGLVPFIWFVSKGAATANRIDNAVPLFGILSAICVAVALVANTYGSGSM